jgi:NTE family protein
MATRRRKPTHAGEPGALDLALQGGGSHGAFTWGVLDRLLEDETLAIDGVCGTSAGALNAAVLATGWAEGGRAGATRALRAFWLDIAEQGGCFGNGGGSSVTMEAGVTGSSLEGNWLYMWSQQFLRTFSPYQFNPLDINPLRGVLLRHVREDALRKGPLSLFVTATAVRTGQPRIFQREDLSVDALLASACLPQLFRAVVVDGEPYWDGGYSGNPAIWPLIYATPALDVMLVKIDPLVRPETPDTSGEIADRINEITFNASLVSEMRAISFVQRLVREGRLSEGEYKGLRLHMIADENLGRLHPSSKLNTDRRFLEGLFDLGRAAAQGWLARHRSDVGVRSTFDPAEVFLARRSAARPEGTQPR